MVCFHLAFPVASLSEAKKFYIDGLGCRLGRENKKAIIIGFYGHQLVAHLVENFISDQIGFYPRHFGMVFDIHEEWRMLYSRAKKKGLCFYQEEFIRFAGEYSEHHSFFLQDPSGNLLEFKYYKNTDAILGNP